MTARKPADETSLEADLEKSIRNMLKTALEPVEKIKVMEVAVKFLAIKYKSKDDDDDGEGSYFKGRA